MEVFVKTAIFTYKKWNKEPSCNELLLFYPAISSINSLECTVRIYNHYDVIIYSFSLFVLPKTQ